jgi:Dyp-type peroxidase family
VELERKDIQGLIVSSYARDLHCAAYVLLRVENAAGARAWLLQNIKEITTAEAKQEHFSTNLAFTVDGLKNLGLDQEALTTFSRPFQEGMATEHRSRILGDDNEENIPSNWDWGGLESKRVDLLLLIYAENEDTLKAQLQKRREEFNASGALTEVKTLEAGRQQDSHEHFGFNDGVGQPVMEGTGNKERQLKRTNHATELPAGEFLMGHKNVYEVTADSPAVTAEKDPLQILTVVPGNATGLNAKPGMHDLGYNGTYLVFRQLAQDVAKFWNFMDQATLDKNKKSDPWARERLAAKFVGRWKSGAPLVLSPKCDDRTLAEENKFGYRDKDAAGFHCPIGSHIRRANPRDSLGESKKVALDSANRHRILRRGRSYGHHLENPMVDDGVARGLHFICLNSDIERQFEFVQQTWINSPVFGGLDGEVDPLVGNLPKGDCIFTVQANPLRERIHGLSRFVTVKGGAYFFLPSMRALNYLATLGSSRGPGEA